MPFRREDLKDIPIESLVSLAKTPGKPYDDARTVLYHRTKKAKFTPFSASEVLLSSGKPDGGATVDLVNGRLLRSGFALSPFDDRGWVLKKELATEEELMEVLLGFYAENKDVLESPQHYIGLWRSPAVEDDYALFVAVAVVVEDASEARRICEEKHQISFFDFQTERSEFVRGKYGQKDKKAI